MNSIYLVTVMNEKSNRCWGWFPTFEDAEEVILNNITDIFEYYYHYAVIEEMPPGPCRTGKQMAWYEADYNVTEKPRPRIAKIETPKEFERVFNFGIG